MKLKSLAVLLMAGTALSAFAQGYKDGVEYVKVNLPEEGRILLVRNMNKPETNKAEANYYLGRIEIADGNITEAKKYFDAGISSNPDFALNYVGLGAVELASGNDKAAKDMMKKAAGLAKKDAVVFVEIARSYYKADATKYTKEIDENINKAKKADKKNPDIYLFEGEMLADQEKWGDAAGFYEMAFNFDPEYVPAYVNYASTYFNVSPDVAISTLNGLVKRKPESALAQNRLAETYYRDNQLTNSAKVYREYINNPNHFEKDKERFAVLLYFGENHDEAYELASTILAKNPDSFLMKRIQFLSKAGKKDYEQAAAHAETFFADNNPNNKFSANDYTTYGEVLKELGQDSLAIIQYEKAIAINPDKTELLKDLSSAYNHAKQYDKSAEAYQRYIDAGDYKTNDLYVLAGRYMTVVATEKDDSVKMKQALANGVKYIDMAIEKVPNDYRLLQRKARLYMSSDRDVKDTNGFDAYMELLEFMDKDAENKDKYTDVYKEIYTYIAGCYLKNGDKDKAKEYYNLYLEVDPENDALREYINNMK